MSVKQRFPIGVDNFKKLVEDNYLFVDHTRMIQEFIETGDELLLILRPRRWGKSLTLSMLYYFIAANEPKTEKLFDGLKIATFDGGAFIKAYQGKHPVILLSLKSIKETRYQDFLEAMTETIRQLYASQQYLLTSEKLTKTDKKLFTSYLESTANKAELANSIKTLSKFLQEHFGQPAYILIDEYDTPMNFASRDLGELEKITEFMKTLLGAALKGNDSLKKGLMTGILRLSKNNMLSDLNNLEVYSALDDHYSQYYGFSEEEVNTLFQICGLTHQAEEIKRWYNGYYSGNRIVYNPWSIIHCVAKQGAIKPYWVLTSSDDLIKQAFINSNEAVKQKFAQLLLGNSIEGIIETTTKFEEITTSSNALWTLLFYAGYLKVTSRSQVDLNEACQLTIPNEEVACVYRTIFREWLEKQIGDSYYQSLLVSLSKGDVELFITHLNEFLLQSTSFRDFTRESDYHCFVLGLMSGMMHTHQVDSNKEQGFGFSDLTLIPLDTNNRLGLIFEFKNVKLSRPGIPIIDEPSNQSLHAEKLKSAAEAGLKQIADRDYNAIFSRKDHQHVQVILEIGMAFLGKGVSAAYRTVNSKTGEVLTSGYVSDVREQF